MSKQPEVQLVRNVYHSAEEVEKTPNKEMMKYGAIAAAAGLLLAMIPATRTLGFIALLGGAAVIWFGMKKVTRYPARPCPHCRTQISGRATICLACHQSVPQMPVQ